jgi:hypothetical protein
MLLANALKSVGYTSTVPMDTVLFLTIGKSDIYHHKSLGKLALDFYLSMAKPE